MKRLAITAALVLVLLAGACDTLTEAQERYNKGVDLAEKEWWEEAIAEYDKAIELDPTHPSA